MRRKIGAIGESMECGLKKLRSSSAIRIRVSSMTSGRRSLLQEIRLSDSDYFRAEGNQEGVYIYEEGI
jgi:hypothetical protein